MALNTCVGISAIFKFECVFPEGGWRLMRRVYKDEVVGEKACQTTSARYAICRVCLGGRETDDRNNCLLGV